MKDFKEITPETSLAEGDEVYIWATVSMASDGFVYIASVNGRGSDIAVDRGALLAVKHRPIRQGDFVRLRSRETEGYRFRVLVVSDIYLVLSPMVEGGKPETVLAADYVRVK